MLDVLDIFELEDAPFVGGNFSAVVDGADIECWQINDAVSREESVDLALALELGRECLCCHCLDCRWLLRRNLVLLLLLLQLLHDVLHLILFNTDLNFNSDLD